MLFKFKQLTRLPSLFLSNNILSLNSAVLCEPSCYIILSIEMEFFSYFALLSQK